MEALTGLIKIAQHQNRQLGSNCARLAPQVLGRWLDWRLRPKRCLDWLFWHRRWLDWHCPAGNWEVARLATSAACLLSWPPGRWDPANAQGVAYLVALAALKAPPGRWDPANAQGVAYLAALAALAHVPVAHVQRVAYLAALAHVPVPCLGKKAQSASELELFVSLGSAWARAWASPALPWPLPAAVP